MPLPNEPVFYLDESIFSHALLSALLTAGARVERVGGVVQRGAQDDAWLQVVGRNGWIALTRDQRIRYRTIERQALIRHGVGSLTFTGGQATGTQTAERVLDLLPRFVTIARSEPRPFLFTFGLNGPLSRVRLIR